MQNFFLFFFVLSPEYEKKLAETKGLILLAADLFTYPWFIHILVRSSPVI
jgi:hypothetical protein